MNKLNLRHPLDGATLAILRRLRSILEAEGRTYFLVGATARDVLLKHVFGIDTGRATRDVDFAIALESWEAFERIRQALIADGHFSQLPGTAIQRFYDDKHYPVDLIPFGAIEGATGDIAWPPRGDIVMNVAGYQEALAAAEQVEVEPGHLLRVSSIPGLAVLKLLAWDERGLADPKDAQDLLLLLASYAGAGNENRLYEGDGMPFLSTAGFDPDVAGAALLGQDCRRMIGTPMLARITAILQDLRKRDRLILHMRSNKNVPEDKVPNYLRHFEEGLATDR